MAFRTPKFASGKVPSLPLIARKLKEPQDTHQLVGSVRNGDLAGNPVPDGSLSDMQSFRSLSDGQARIGQLVFETQPKLGAGFP